MPAFFELRQYKLKPARPSPWVKFMEEAVIPLQTEQGTVIVGSFLVENDPETYIWIDAKAQHRHTGTVVCMTPSASRFCSRRSNANSNPCTIAPGRGGSPGT